MPSQISPAWNTPAHLVSNRQVKPADLSTEVDITIKSPLLFEMLNKVSQEKKNIILDISQANRSSLEFFSDTWCKLYFTNSITEISKLETSSINTAHKWHRALVKSVGFYKNDKTDIDMILLWGLPNYLSKDQLKGLSSYLLPQCSKNTYLHMYIFNSEFMSRLPANYKIHNKNSVSIKPQNVSDEIVCPMYHLTNLQKYLAPFTLDHSVMLSSGIQEYIFKLS